MNASELFRVLEGVPDEALPDNIRRGWDGADQASDYIVHAIVGAMTAWLWTKTVRIWAIAENGPYVVVVGTFDEKQNFTGASRLKALAAACRAVSQGAPR